MTTSASLCEGPIFYFYLLPCIRVMVIFTLPFYILSFGKQRYVGKILVHMANWMWVFMNYYCWLYPWGKTLGGKTISPIFLCVRLNLRTHKYCVSVSNCERLYDSWVCGLAENSYTLTLSYVMINCNCCNDWDYSLLVFNEVYDSYLKLWMNCYFSIRDHMTIYIYMLLL
mgnify:CR=1 FL=1